MNTSHSPETAKPLSAAAIRSRVEKSSDSMAMLPKAFYRFGQALVKELLKFAPAAPSFSYDGSQKTEAHQVKEIDDNANLSEVLVSGDLRESIRITVDREIVFGICDLAFGGVGNEPAYAEARPFSKIECAVMRLFFDAVGRSLPAAFFNISLKDFFVAPVQNPNEDPFFPPFKPFISVRMLCNIHGYSGEMRIELPEKLATLIRPAGEEKLTSSALPTSEWGAKISDRVENIEMELTVVLSEFIMSLDRVTKLQTGEIIEFTNDISSSLAVCSEGVKLFDAKLGQSARKFCVSIEKSIASPG